jgi:hypothetical protein
MVRPKYGSLVDRLAERNLDHEFASDLTNLLELSWAAGFADGEACITISKTQLRGRANPTYRLLLTLNQNHPGSLTRFADAVGVHPRLYKVKRTTRMNRDAYVLNIGDQHAVRVLKALLPFLERKAPEAEVALDAYEQGRFDVHPGPNGHPAHIWAIREFYYLKLQRMK